MSDHGRRAFAASLIAVALGGGLALLVSGRPWATAEIARATPLPHLSVDLSGRTLQAGVPGLAVVALAGLVALLATRGVARRIVGGVVGLAGALLTAAALTGLHVGTGRARTLVIEARTGAVLDGAARLRVTEHPLWPVLAAGGGVLVLLGGGLIAVRGADWVALGRRYDAPTAAASAPVPAEEDERARSDLALWKSLDRGEDPTTRTQS